MKGGSRNSTKKFHPPTHTLSPISSYSNISLNPPLLQYYQDFNPSFPLAKISSLSIKELAWETQNRILLILRSSHQQNPQKRVNKTPHTKHKSKANKHLTKVSLSTAKPPPSTSQNHSSNLLKPTSKTKRKKEIRTATQNHHHNTLFILPHELVTTTGSIVKSPLMVPHHHRASFLPPHHRTTTAEVTPPCLTGTSPSHHSHSTQLSQPCCQPSRLRLAFTSLETITPCVEIHGSREKKKMEKNSNSKFY